MNLTVVVLLATLWAAILAPALLRGRGGRSPAASIDSFERSMGILASDRFTAPRMPGRHVMVVHDPARLSGRRPSPRVQRQRRRVLLGLLTAVVLTASAALAVGGVLVHLFGLTVLAAGGYVALLAHLHDAERRRRRVVRHLAAADAPRPRPVSARRVTDRIA